MSTELNRLTIYKPLFWGTLKVKFLSAEALDLQQQHSVNIKIKETEYISIRRMQYARRLIIGTKPNETSGNTDLSVPTKIVGDVFDGYKKMHTLPSWNNADCFSFVNFRMNRLSLLILTRVYRLAKGNADAYSMYTPQLRRKHK